MTHIPEKHLKDTCEFILASYRRKAVETCMGFGLAGAAFDEHHAKLSGISNLYVGKKEHAIVQDYLNRLSRARERQILRDKNSMDSGVARLSPLSPDDVGEGATLLDVLIPLQAG